MGHGWVCVAGCRADQTRAKDDEVKQSATGSVQDTGENTQLAREPSPL